LLTVLPEAPQSCPVGKPVRAWPRSGTIKIRQKHVRFPIRMAAAHAISFIGVVLSDAEFDSELNHAHIRQEFEARSVILAKGGKKTWRINGICAEMRKQFPCSL